ncbi:MAG: GNAT family N-acetyltransferase [Ruminococcaceae bacterium]|nr:GNAT family N-acetyltransferase [Oscillospiraceae bacterium]
MSDNKSYSIRPCTLDDLDAMREICIETSSMSLRDDKDRKLLLLMFCDSYMQYADCFVAVDEADRPVGYTLCALNTREFFINFRKNILPEITKLGFRYSATAYGIIFLHRLCVIFAPSHLHIDLTEAVRRQGVGTALMNTVKSHLAEKGIKSVQLTCGSSNKSAISFYKKNGFKTVFRGFGSCVMRANTK